MKNKSNFGARESSQRGGCGIGGCFGVGCLVVFLLLGAAGMGGYYSLMYTSLPLQFIESAIEQTGDVEIEGLDGSLSDGFSAEEFRFKTNDDQWSTLNDINVQYESKSSFFSGDKFTIDDASIQSGTIYAQWDPAKQQIDLTPDFENGGDADFTLNGNQDEGEVFIKNISVNDLEIVNTEADVSIKIDQAKISNFHVKDGELISLGELTVSSNQLDLKTSSSDKFDERLNLDIETRFEGTVKADIDSRLGKDFAFSFDYGITTDMEKLHVVARLFDGAMIVSDSPDNSTVEYKNLDLVGYLSDTADVMAPSEINFRLEFDEHDESIVKVSDDGSLKLGQTAFSDVRLASDAEISDSLVCDGVVDGQPVTFSFTVDSAFSPWKSLELTSPNFEGTKNDLWSATYFGEAFDDLDENHQKMIEDVTGESTSEEAAAGEMPADMEASHEDD